MNATVNPLSAKVSTGNKHIRSQKMQVIVDRRGKTMAKGGRYGVAKQARFLRGSGAGNHAARAYIASAKTAYRVDAGPFEGWSAGQQKHNRLVVQLA